MLYCCGLLWCGLCVEGVVLVLELTACVVRDLYCHFCILAMIVDLVSVFNSVVFIYSLMLYMFVIVRCGLLRGWLLW